MQRYIFFALATLVGGGLGLLFGWVVSPVEVVETSPDTLRVDYQADYVLMVAEAYWQEEDAEAAVLDLALLGGDSPIETIRAAIVFAVQNEYQPDDLVLMRALEEALLRWDPALEGTNK